MFGCDSISWNIACLENFLRQLFLRSQICSSFIEKLVFLLYFRTSHYFDTHKVIDKCKVMIISAEWIVQQQVTSSEDQEEMSWNSVLCFPGGLSFSPGLASKRMQITSKQSSLSLNVWPQLFVLISPSLSFCFVLFSSVKWEYRESAACPPFPPLPFLSPTLQSRLRNEEEPPILCLVRSSDD